MAEITISTSRQSCKPDCNQLNIIDRTIMNKYSEIDESPSTDTEESFQGKSVHLSLNVTKMIQNKLKRKKKLSSSLTSVGDTVNQEKRTRIEGIQLNCRGKLNEGLLTAAASLPTSPSTMAPQQQSQIKLECVKSRTLVPSPRVAEKIIMLQQSQQSQQQQQQMSKVPPPRLKRKLEENVITIQKLNAQTEQMRLEITELKAQLGTEKGAVRVLRAQNESESRKWKNEVKKLQTTMELMRKVKKSKDEACANWMNNNNNTSSSANSAKEANITNHELQRLTNEIASLKDANRNLEEKLQISNDAERRKAADLRELKDSYEIRLTQLSKSAKTEISRLLEEIKTKERNIGQLKKETQTLQKPKTNKTTKNNKKESNPKNAAQLPSEMKKLKEIERNKNNINNSMTANKNITNKEKCFITTTCGEKEFHSMPHEFTERILEAHNDVHAYRSKQDHQNSDSDSALSSAPPSISPQPPPTGMEPADIWQTIKNYTKDIEKVQNDLELIQKENETLQKELSLAKQQILESEKTALEATNNVKNQQKLLERIEYLEHRENELQDETHELREQNELLEFRILELEESNDKWSLQSNTTPNSKNVWNNGGKDSDDAIIFADRSDSGVTSPHSHHHIDDRINVISPCDLNLCDHMTNDDLRRRLGQMIKKPSIDEEDKICLQQVLAFIQNLDAMSHGHDSLPSSEESSSLEYIKSRVSDYSSSPRSSDASPTILVQKPKSAPSTGRIVATVLPYNSTVSTPNDSPQRKLRAWHTSSLTESGVFEGDLSETSVYTQTEPEDFICQETTKDQFNRFRERFEECTKKYGNAKVPVPSHSPNLTDQKRIDYYKERLEVLEGKLIIYESSGDLQAKRLADRLQKEIQLEKLVKELRDRVDFLEIENAEIEEEKCEFEEAENDTRLRLQRLEVELEILSQRNIELEMSREALQNKLKDCRSESAILRDDLAACQTQVCNLEEDRSRYKENLEFLHSTLPALILYNAFAAANNSISNYMERENADPEMIPYDKSDCNYSEPEEAYKKEAQSLREEIKRLRRQISDLNSRHTEALACADGYWEDLEKSYTDQLEAFKSKEDSLKQKIKKLEDCLQDDSRAANEKICQLEEAERELKICLQKVSREHRETLQEHNLITEEYQLTKEKYERLKEQLDGPVKEALEREKTQNKNLKDELGYMRRTSCEQEMHYRNELDCFQMQLEKLQKELLQIQVTNSELREEVLTLEKEVISLQNGRKEDLDKIRCLSDEVRTKEDMCAILEKRVEKLINAPYHRQKQAHVSGRLMSASCSGAVPSLAQELNGSPVKRLKIEDPSDLKTATRNLETVLGSLKESAKTIPTHRQFQTVANDVKKLAETLLANKSGIELLNELEEKLNSRLLKFHCMKMESEFCCGTGATQNDRYRDHTNLSNQPNNKAPAGDLRRQPAGHRQKHHAKDYNDDSKIWNKQSSLEHSSSTKGSSLSSRDNIAKNVYKLSKKSETSFYTPEGSNECLHDAKKDVDSNRKHKNLAQYSYNVKSGLSITETASFNIEMRKLETCIKRCCKKHLKVAIPKGSINKILSSKFSEDQFCKENTARNDHLVQIKEEELNVVQDMQPDERTTKPDKFPDEKKYQCCTVSSQLTKSVSYCSVGTVTTPRNSIEDNNLMSMLKSIHDVLLSMKNDWKNIASNSGEKLKVIERTDPTPPPPSSSSSNHNVSFSPLNVYDGPNEDNLKYALPENDESKLKSESRKLIPIDMSLLRTDGTFDWDPKIKSRPSKECQTNFYCSESSSAKVLDKGVQVESFQSPLKKSSLKKKSYDSVQPEEISEEFLIGANNFSREGETKNDELDFCDCFCEKSVKCESDCCKLSEQTPQPTKNASGYCQTSNIEIMADGVSKEIQTNEKSFLKLNTSMKDDLTTSPELLAEENIQNQISIAEMPLEDMASIKTEESKGLKSTHFDVGTNIPEFSDLKEIASNKIEGRSDLSSILDVGTDVPELLGLKEQATCCVQHDCQCNQPPSQYSPEDSNLMDSIYHELEVMKSARENALSCYSFSQTPNLNNNAERPSENLGFPVTIEKVEELGSNSLFVKWKVHDINNIEGYEIFLDGILTNQYFSSVHRSAVICAVDLRLPHKIVLRAQSDTPQMNAEARCPQPDGSVWYPSVYHFEPNFHSAPTNAFLN